MRLKVSSSKVVLEPGQILTIDDARGVHIRPVGAKVWVTEEGDCSDFVVNPGEEFVVSCKGRTVVQAIAEGRRAAYAVDAYLRGNDLSAIRTRQTLAEPQPEFLSIVPFTGEVKEPR